MFFQIFCKQFQAQRTEDTTYTKGMMLTFKLYLDFCIKSSQNTYNTTLSPKTTQGKQYCFLTPRGAV